jgi:hypothetical protein
MRKTTAIVAGPIDELGHDRVDVLGVSWGGALAQELTHRHPEMVHRLILTATMPGVTRAGASCRHGGADVTRPVLLASQLGYVYQLSAIQRWTSLPWLHRLRHRTPVLAGDQDPIVRLVNGRIMANRIPDGRLHVVEGGGHLFLFTRGAEIMLDTSGRTIMISGANRVSATRSLAGCTRMASRSASELVTSTRSLRRWRVATRTGCCVIATTHSKWEPSKPGSMRRSRVLGGSTVSSTTLA